MVPEPEPEPEPEPVIEEPLVAKEEPAVSVEPTVSEEEDDPIADFHGRWLSEISNRLKRRKALRRLGRT